MGDEEMVAWPRAVESFSCAAAHFVSDSPHRTNRAERGGACKTTSPPAAMVAVAGGRQQPVEVDHRHRLVRVGALLGEPGEPRMVLAQERRAFLR